jgi:hypothetical protein
MESGRAALGLAIFFDRTSSVQRTTAQVMIWVRKRRCGEHCASSRRRTAGFWIHARQTEVVGPMNLAGEALVKE